MGLIHTVDNLDKCLESIKNTVETKEKRIEYLEKENKKLKDAAYKDEELKKMQQHLERMQADYRRGFPITEAEEKAIKKWCDEHDRKAHGLKTDRDKIKAGGCIGGRYEFIFVPTSIGVLGEVKCSCGKKFTFSDL